jgi:hypothetical protein
LSKIFGGGEKRIRKDAGELQLADFEKFSAWEFCHDEESVEGQTESTMRPLRGVKRVEWPSFDGLVSVDMIASGGKRFVGFVQPGETLDHPWSCSPEIVLAAQVGTIVSHALLETYNQMLRSHSARIGLYVPGMSPADVRSLVPVAYQAIDIRPEELWPITVRQVAPPRATTRCFERVVCLDGPSPPNTTRAEPRVVAQRRRCAHNPVDAPSNFAINPTNPLNHSPHP